MVLGLPMNVLKCVLQHEHCRHTHTHTPCKRGYVLLLSEMIHLKTFLVQILSLEDSDSVSVSSQVQLVHCKRCRWKCSHYMLHHYSSKGTNSDVHYCFNRKGHALLICVVHNNDFVMLKCFLLISVGAPCLVGSNWRRASRLPPVTSLPQLNL